MSIKTAVKIIISSVLGIIIDKSFSITDIMQEALKPLLVGPFLEPIKPLFTLIFYLIEISSIYGIINKINWLNKILE